MKLDCEGRWRVDAIPEDGRKHAQSSTREPHSSCFDLQDASLDDLFALALYFLHLCGQTSHVIFEPAGHIHVVFTHALQGCIVSVSYTHLRAHETRHDL